MKNDRHSKDYYVNYARKHPNWCKAHWYLSKDELDELRNSNKNEYAYLI